MNIYEHRATIATVAGSANSSTLNIRGGLIKQIIVRANTSQTTMFRVTLIDTNSANIRNYAYHQGELNDMQMDVPVSGLMTVNISSSSAAETYTVIAKIQE